MSFEEAYKEFLIYAAKRHKKQGFETIHRNFNKHVLPYFKNKDVCKLTKIDIITWQNQILELNFSNSYNRNLCCAFSTFIDFCILKGYLDYNVVLSAGNIKKKIEVKNYDVYSLSEFRKFRHNLDSFIYKQYFNCIFFLGTRPGEAMGLRFCDIKGNYIHICHNLQRRGTRELDTPKNQSSVRYVKLSYLMLFRFFILKQFYFKKYGEFSENYFIFGGKRPLSSTSIDRHKLNACKKANIRSITQHQFRHSYATRMIHKRKPIDYVSKSMGHSKVSMTVDVYLHQEKIVHNSTILSRLFF